MMTPRQLEAYDAVMRTGSVSAAASLLHISQPSISRLIAELERTAGFKLFRKVGRGIAPTGEGRRFHLAVERLFFGLDGLSEAADRIRRTSGESVNLGVIPAMAQTLAPESVAELRQQCPDAYIHLTVGNTPALVEQVQLRQLDLAIVSGDFPKDDLFTLGEFELPYVCLLPRDHPLAQADSEISVSQLLAEECIVMDQPFMQPSSDIEKIREHSKVASASMPAIVALARCCNRPALVDPSSAIAAAQSSDMVIRELKQTLLYPYALIGWRNDDGAPPIRVLVESLINRFIHLLERN